MFMSDLQAERNYELAVCLLASGSKGNAIYVTDGHTSVLIDAGLSGKEIQRRMNSRGLSPEALNGIIVSHEHSDHIQSVGTLSRRFRIPVYMSQKTAGVIGSQIGKMFDLHHFQCGTPFSANSLSIHPFSISHDAEDPAGFTLQKNGIKIGVATDLGIATAMVKEHLKDATLLILEANHDPVMLMEGPYPWFLKQRIKGRSGHLSNEDTQSLLGSVRSARLTHVILAHLSETNNHPDLARKVVGQAVGNQNIRISVAEQDQCGELVTL